VGFVPLTGPATLRAGEPSPRAGTVTFTDHRRTVELPIRSAVPVLARAARDDATHPTVTLLAPATVLGLRVVAEGRFQPGPDGWGAGPLGPEDEERVRLLARARAPDGMDAAAAEGLVLRMVSAVVDALPDQAPGARRTAPLGRPATAGPAGPRPSTDRDFRRRLDGLLRRHDRSHADDLPHLVRVGLRVEADEEELVAGAVRLVLQVHDERDPLHVCDAALLWTEGPTRHGFGDRARTHAVLALRAAAQAWPVLDRLLDLRVPDQIELGTDEIVSLLDEGVAALAARGVDVLWPRALGRDLTTRTVLEHRGGEGRSGPRPDAPLDAPMFGPGALFSFDWQVALHGDPLTPEEMDVLARATSPVLRLRDQWMVVDPSVARRARRRMVRTLRPTQALAATLTGVVEVEETDTEVVVGATLERVRERIRTAATRDPVPVPAGLAATLRDYQRHGLTWLAEMTSLGLGPCLADDMGLGKTVTLIALHLHRHEHGVATPTLVVCPASLLGTWEAELARFAPSVPVRRFHAGSRSLSGLAPDAVVLTTYGTMRRSAEELAEVGWDLVVADEAQHVKNPRSSTARALRRIGSTARVALTGTPVENDLGELWSIMDWLTPGLLGSRPAFRRSWAAPIETGVDPARARQFADLVRPFLLRRRKSDPGVAPELPAKTETDHLLRLTREQVVLYESYVRDLMDRIERADEESRRGLVLALLTGLKQICNHPAHFLRQSGGRLSGRSEKLDLLDEVVGTVLAEEGAVLVFTQYVAMGRLLEQHLAVSGVPHQFLHGGTPVAERERMVAAFQAGEVPVFLLSLRAGGTGLTLTRADHVVHLDRWWNPAVEEQATDRAYRIGQTRPVQVHRPVVRGTIEERIGQMLDRKRALADAVLGRGEAALTELDDAELRDLVTLRRPEGP
jgi:superfamily II DNA or RNA helicase